MSQSPIWGGGDHVKFILTQPKSVSSDPSFRPWHFLVRWLAQVTHPIVSKYIEFLTHTHLPFLTFPRLFFSGYAVVKVFCIYTSHSNVFIEAADYSSAYNVLVM